MLKARYTPSQASQKIPVIVKNRKRRKKTIKLNKHEGNKYMIVAIYNMLCCCSSESLIRQASIHYMKKELFNL